MPVRSGVGMGGRGSVCAGRPSGCVEMSSTNGSVCAGRQVPGRARPGHAQAVPRTHAHAHAHARTRKRTLKRACARRDCVTQSRNRFRAGGHFRVFFSSDPDVTPSWPESDRGPLGWIRHICTGTLSDMHAPCSHPRASRARANSVSSSSPRCRFVRINRLASASLASTSSQHPASANLKQRMPRSPPPPERMQAALQ